ncbi:hypothetical protein MYX07_02065 [Patescibacteria group bacterium AH-259-L07]|nr:hypothetical protein [Patescibacteria group bacterium AH-259-L07]
MSAETKKEKIRKLFKIIGIEKSFKQKRDQETEMFLKIRGRGMTEEERKIIEEFPEEMVKATRACFEQTIGGEFKKDEIDRIIKIQTDPFFDRLDKAEQAFHKGIQMKVDELTLEEAIRLSELRPFPGEDTAEE